jgi:hypothetical protein
MANRFNTENTENAENTENTENTETREANGEATDPERCRGRIGWRE